MSLTIDTPFHGQQLEEVSSPFKLHMKGYGPENDTP